MLGGNDGGGVGGQGFFAVAIALIRADTDIRNPVRGKGGSDTRRAEFAGRCGDTCIRYLFISIKNTPPPIKRPLNKANIHPKRIQNLYR